MANRNGHDDEPPDNKVARFPDSRERAELERRLKAANDQAPPPVAEPVFNLPPAVKILCLVLAVIQLGMWLLSDVFKNELAADWIIGNFGFIVLRYTGGMPFGWQGALSPISHMFLHGGWLHLCVNAVTLLAFGAGVEKRMGWRKMLVLYFGTGVVAAFTHAGLYVVFTAAGNAGLFPHPEGPLIGASGGISGLVSAVFLIMVEEGKLTRRGLTAVVGVTLVSMLAMAYFGAPGEDQPIAWTAHVGGFLAGLALYGPILRSKIRA